MRASGVCVTSLAGRLHDGRGQAISTAVPRDLEAEAAVLAAVRSVMGSAISPAEAEAAGGAD